MNKFLDDYIRAIIFTAPELECYPFSQAARDRLRADCLAFFTDEVLDLLDGAVATVLDPWTQAAHDFWFTRNGHGAGFGDGDWPEPLAKVLADRARAFGPCELYVGDDGLIHVY